MSQKPWPDVTNLPDGAVGIAFAMKLFLVEKSMSEKNPLKNSDKQSPMIVPSIQWKCVSTEKYQTGTVARYRGGIS